jgi:hypothetical protein
VFYSFSFHLLYFLISISFSFISLSPSLFLSASTLKHKQKKDKEKDKGIRCVMCITNDDATRNGSKRNNVMKKEIKDGICFLNSKKNEKNLIRGKLYSKKKREEKAIKKE